MAVTFGFYNSKNGDRTYNAEQMSSIFSGIIKDGVFADHPEEGMQLKVTIGTGLKVVVGPGRAWFNDTWTNNDSPLELDVPAPPALDTMERIDAVVLEVNKTNEADSTPGMTPSSVAGRSNAFVVVTGTASADPQPPTLRDGNGIHQHLIAYVRTRWDHQDSVYWVTNMVGVTNGSPIIIGAVQSVSAENVLAQWHNEVDNLVAAQLAQYLNDDGSMLYSKIENVVGRMHQVYVYRGNLNPDSTTQRAEIYYNDIAVNISDPWRMIPNPAVDDGKFDQIKLNDGVISKNGLLWRVVDIIDTDSEDFSPPSRIVVESVGRYLPEEKTPLEAHFSITNDGATCDKTFAEISQAILDGRELDLIYDISNTMRAKLTYVYNTNAAGTEIVAITANYSDIWPSSSSLGDWGWEVVSFTYHPNRLTYVVSTQ